jgi:hypothetical protein
MSSRPRIKIPLDTFDYIVETKSLLGVVASWLLLFALDFTSFFLIPCIVVTTVYLLLTWLTQYPHIFNYPVTITQQNAFRQYVLAIRLLRFLKLVVVLGFLGLTIIISLGKGLNGAWTAPVILGLTIIPLILYFIASRRIG